LSVESRICTKNYQLEYRKNKQKSLKVLVAIYSILLYNVTMINPSTPDHEPANPVTDLIPDLQAGRGLGVASVAIDETLNVPESIPEDPVQQVRKYVLEVIGDKEPDALIVLSAGIRQQTVKGEPTGRWKSVAWGHAGDLGLHTGSRTRVSAGAFIAKAFPEIPVVANSYNRNNADEPTMASVVKGELIQRGVEEDRIVLEEESFSTITQYIEALRLATENKWKNVAVMINEYYEPRAKAIFTHLAEIVDDPVVQKLVNTFADKGGRFVFVNSESVLRTVDPLYIKYFEEIYRSPQYKEMLGKEAQGLEDIKAGRYKYSLRPNVLRT